MTATTGPRGEAGPPGGDKRAATRAALELAVRMRLDTAVEYRSGLTANVSASGMYVMLDEPPPVGTLVQFELDRAGGRGALRGAGEVIWIRVRQEGPGRPPGVGIHFRYLEGDGRGYLEEAVRIALAQGAAGEVWPPRSRPPGPPAAAVKRPRQRPVADRPAARTARPGSRAVVAAPKAARPSSEKVRGLWRRLTAAKPAGTGRPGGATGRAPRDGSGEPKATHPRQLVILAVLMLILLLILMRL